MGGEAGTGASNLEGMSETLELRLNYFFKCLNSCSVLDHVCDLEQVP